MDVHCKNECDILKAASTRTNLNHCYFICEALYKANYIYPHFQSNSNSNFKIKASFLVLNFATMTLSVFEIEF